MASNLTEFLSSAFSLISFNEDEKNTLKKPLIPPQPQSPPVYQPIKRKRKTTKSPNPNPLKKIKDAEIVFTNYFLEHDDKITKDLTFFYQLLDTPDLDFFITSTKNLMKLYDQSSEYFLENIVFFTEIIMVASVLLISKFCFDDDRGGACIDLHSFIQFKRDERDLIFNVEIQLFDMVGKNVYNILRV